jgi:hypothetical protein
MPSVSPFISKTEIITLIFRIMGMSNNEYKVTVLLKGKSIPFNGYPLAITHYGIIKRYYWYYPLPLSLRGKKKLNLE